jgi:hypothetical protein
VFVLPYLKKKATKAPNGNILQVEDCDLAFIVFNYFKPEARENEGVCTVSQCHKHAILIFNIAKRNSPVEREDLATCKLVVLSLSARQTITRTP